MPRIYGLEDVRTFLNSGDVVFSSSSTGSEDLSKRLEKLLIKNFQFDSQLIKVQVVAAQEMQNVVEKAPKGFGSHPKKYHSDVIFLIGIEAKLAFAQFATNPAVDTVWQGESVIYYQRLSELRTKSRLSKIVDKPLYKSMTIRTWKTTTKLLPLLLG